MDMNVAETVVAEPAPASGLVYDGTLSELYAIFWRNLLLTVLTVGVFRFWAITRNRRYLWSRTSFQGDRFEYTGSGSEKLWSFVKVMLLLLLLYVAVVGVLLVAPGRPGLVALLGFGIGIFMALLGAAAPFTAQRYRLARTRWRGLSGGMQGSAMGYGLKSLLMSIGYGFSFSLLIPYGRLRLAEARIAASRFADVGFRFKRTPGVAFGTYVTTLVLKGLVFSGVVGSASGLFVATGGSDGASQPGPWYALFLPILAVLAFRSLNRVCNAWFDAAVLRRVLEQTRYLDLRLESRVGGEALFFLRVGNLLIGVLTLGLGGPIIRQRCARFVATGIVTTGALDVAALHRESSPGPREAEGLFEAFDVGFLY